MPGRQGAVFNQLCHRLAEVQQTQGVGHGGAGFADTGGGVLLGQAIVVDELLIAAGLFHRVQVFPLQILHQRKLRDAAVVRLQDPDRDFQQAGHPGGAPAALAGNDLIIPVFEPAHDHRLDQAVPRNGGGEVLQALFIKALARLILTRLHLGEGKRADLIGFGL